MIPQTNAQRESFWHRVAFDMTLRGVTNEALAHRLLDVSLATADDEAVGLIDEARRRLLVWTATPEEIDRQEEAQIDAMVLTPEDRAAMDAVDIERIIREAEGNP